MKKKTFLILTLAVLLVTALVIGLWLYNRMVPNSDVQEYNTYATAQAYSTGQIGQNDVLILKSIQREFDGNSNAEFCIYRLPEGKAATAYFGKTASQIGDEMQMIGTATCIFVDDDPTQVRSLSAIFTQ